MTSFLKHEALLESRKRRGVRNPQWLLLLTPILGIFRGYIVQNISGTVPAEFAEAPEFAKGLPQACRLPSCR